MARKTPGLYLAGQWLLTCRMRTNSKGLIRPMEVTMMIGIPVQLGDAATLAATVMSHSRVQNATQVEAGIYVANSSTSIFLISRAGS